MEDEIKKHMREAISDARSLWYDSNNQQIIYELAVVLFTERKEISEVQALLKEYDDEDKDKQDSEKDKSKDDANKIKFSYDSSNCILSPNKFILSGP